MKMEGSFEDEKMSQGATLDWTGKLYDRQAEEAQLRDVYRRRMHPASGDKEFVLISGPSGTGKTALAYTIKDHVLTNGGYFISGKFDQLQRSEPYAPFVAAFTEFANQIVLKGVQEVDAIKDSILRAIDSECRLLIDLVPALEQILGPHEPFPRGNGVVEHKRLMLVFRQFVQVISYPQRPLLLFLDDLQWADFESLDLIKALASNVISPGFILLGACRGNEVALSHPLSVVLRDLEDDSVTINNITVQNLDTKAVREMVSDVLRLPDHKCLLLAELLVQRTDGNVLFVRQLLRSLWEEGILYFDSNSKEWVWHEDRMQLSLRCLDVVQLLAEKICRFPTDVQEVLKVASCIGVEFDQYLLQTLLPSQVVFGLNVAKENGLIDLHCSSMLFKFSHDSIQQASYSLIPVEERASFHLTLGRRLCETLSRDEIELHIFLILNQLSMGADLVHTSEEKHRIALMCLQAGEKATLSSAFVTAAEYLNTGIKLLGTRHWRDQYDLSLALFSSAAEVQYCNARFEDMDNMIDEILSHARSFHDQIRARTTRIYSLGARNEPQRAIHYGLDVLRKLGHSIPSTVGTLRFLWEFVKTKKMLGRLSEDEIMNLPQMKDPIHLAVMTILNILHLYAFSLSPELSALVSFRLVQVTLKHGICGMSSPGFGTYGMLLCGVFTALDEGYRYGDLSLRMLERFPGKEWLPRTYVAVYGMINTWKRPFRDSLEPLRLGHQVGLGTGDIEFAMLNAAVYGVCSIYASRPLRVMSRELRSFHDLMKTYKQDQMITLLYPNMQLVENFMGKAKDPLVLTGDVVDQEVELTKARATKNENVLSTYYLYQCVLAYHMEEYSRAMDAAEACRHCKNQATSSFASFGILFFESLVALALANNSPTFQSRHKRTAKRNLKMLRGYDTGCPSNCANKVSLIEAELAFVDRKLGTALIKYEESIVAANKEGLVSEQALACERAGVALRMFGREPEGIAYLVKARSLYADWGASIKVDQLKNIILEALPTS